jgi:hypothetical protein
MAGRPSKHTAEWFSHDANASDGKTLTILENNFGADGYMAWFKLLERISSTDNHIITCRNGEEIEFLAAKLHLKPDRFREIINKMADLEAIDKTLWIENKVIWCQNLVDRLKSVYDNRKQELPHKPSISTTDKSNSIPEIPIPTTDNTTEKGSKVKELKKDIDKPLDIYLKELRERFTDIDFDIEIEKCNLHYQGKDGQSKKKANWHSRYLNWMSNARKFDQERKPKNGEGKRHSTSIPGNRPAGAFSDLEG